MTIDYSFNEYDDFELELTYNEIRDFFDDFSDEEIYQNGIQYFNELPEDEKEEILILWEITDENTIKDNKEFIREVLLELIEDHKEDFKEEMKDFFYDMAKEEYKDASYYNRDPWGYNGVSQSDFL